MKITKVVAAIIIYEKSFLVFQRKYSNNIDFSLKYEFAGGKIKKNESNLEALKREIKEELNISVKNYKPYLEYNYNYKNNKISLSFYLCQVNNLSFNLNVHESYKLLRKQELKDVDWLEADYKVVEYLVKDENLFI
tara:strand:- start:1130 stop:1537 length:408 start_codon:yes stop_codon:yes gene_type:complete